MIINSANTPKVIDKASILVSKKAISAPGIKLNTIIRAFLPSTLSSSIHSLNIIISILNAKYEPPNRAMKPIITVPFLEYSSNDVVANL